MLLAAACLACGSDSGDPVIPELPNGSMEARIDGVRWHATLGLSARVSGPGLVIGGTDAAGTSIVMAIVPSAGPGDYAIGAAATTAGLVTDAGSATWQAQAGAGSGTITVAVLMEDRVAGTFEFTAPAVDGTGAAGSKRVTRGAFDIEY